MGIKSKLKSLWFKNNKKAKSIKSYHRDNIEKVDNLVTIKDKHVLVLGCSTGVDCRLFIEYGANSVDGVDISEKIGSDFQHRKVKYHNISAENMTELENDKYDLVYCLATLEHIPNINNAFNEMVRVTKPNGHIYAYSAPLWNSSQGHHKSNFFHGFPWIHLRMNADEIIRFCFDNDIVETGDDLSINEHVNYMLNPMYFNKVESTKYVDVCEKLKPVNILRNELVYEDTSLLTDSIYNELKEHGYSRNELLAKGHIFIAQKGK